jgi:hypothetical protein
MDEESTQLGFEPEKLAKLWDIDEDAVEGKIDAEEGNRDFFLRLLACSLPEKPCGSESLSDIIMRLCDDNDSTASESIDKQLSDPKAQISLIQRIKDYCKEASDNAHSRMEHEAAVAVYYLALSNALVFHNRKITSHSYDYLIESFSKLIDKKWIPHDKIKLYIEACDRCFEKRKSSNRGPTP